MWRKLVAGLLAAAGVVAALSCGTQTAAESKTFFVRVGAEDLAVGVQYNAFLPENLTIDEGDAIVFTKQTAEQHTVTINPPVEQVPDFFRFTDGELIVVEANPAFFLPAPALAPLPPFGSRIDRSVAVDGNEFVNSGSMETTNDVFRVTFAKAGRYTYMCLLHPRRMRGVITVNATGTPYPKTETEYENDAALTLNQFRTKAQLQLTAAQTPQPVVHQDGSRSFTVLAGTGSTEDGYEFNRFFGGENLTVRVGDTVTWTWAQNTPFRPHTVSFLDAAQTTPQVILEVPAGSGPPRLFVNPRIERPSHSSIQDYNGVGFYNSGILINGGPTPQTYSLGFTKPGTYRYLCLIHDQTGMNGTITVVE